MQEIYHLSRWVVNVSCFVPLPPREEGTRRGRPEYPRRKTAGEQILVCFSGGGVEEEGAAAVAGGEDAAAAAGLLG